MKKVLLGLAAVAITSAAMAQTIFTQDFEGTSGTALPTGWSQASTSTASGWQSGTATTLGSTYYAPPAHTRFVAVNDDKDSTYNNSNDLLKTQTFSLTGVSNAFLALDVYFLQGTYNGATEALTVEASTNGGTSWTVIQTLPSNSVNDWETKFISLSSLNNAASVMLGFRYADGSGWLYGAALDNIKVFVPAANDIALTSVSPTAGSPVSYGVSGGNVTIGGTVFNNGATPITSYTIKYQQGAGAVASYTKTGVNVAPFSSDNFTHTTPFTVPAVNNYTIKVWAELAGDANHTNDSGSTTITGVSFMPKKKLVIEEATGTWCGWCVRGIVYMDSLWKTNSNDVSLVAVHNNDPMTLSAYDSWIGTQISGYPSVVIDRRELADPSDLFGSAGADIFNNEKNYFGYADITLGNAAYTGNNFTLPVTVKPALNLSGDYRLLLVLTEDGAHGTTDHNSGTANAWDMHNYYSSGSQNLPLSGGGVNYQTSPVYIPASQMFYNFVGRALIPSINGAAGSLPASMTAGTTYSYSFTGTVDPSWDKNKIRAVVMLLRNSDGVVLNSNNTRWSLGVGNVAAGIDKFSVYPNPAKETANLHFELSGASSVGVEVVDVMGKVVSTIPAAQMGAGEHTVSLPVSNLASGLYNVKISTASGTVTERLSVVK